jgi:HAD superfamily hydrolase (TIGR01509 family)
MAVATGATRAICIRTLEAIGLRHYFQAIVTADDVVHGKPAPDIFLEAARQIGVNPKECCAFEDAEMGLRAARDAGMIAIDIRPLRK